MAHMSGARLPTNSRRGVAQRLLGVRPPIMPRCQAPMFQMPGRRGRLRRLTACRAGRILWRSRSEIVPPGGHMRRVVVRVVDDESLRTSLLRPLRTAGLEAHGFGSTGDFLLDPPRTAPAAFCSIEALQRALQRDAARRRCGGGRPPPALRLADTLRARCPRRRPGSSTSSRPIVRTARPRPGCTAPADHTGGERRW